MTVGESMTASAANPVVPPPSGPPHSQGHGQPHGQVQGDVVPPVPRGQGANPMALKVNQEVLTSLHLIEDIRRLEKYQRDFFLKVKESLTHVHALLDHQLMDMAWSDNLADCEENLLKVSTHVQTSSTSQLADVYNILLHDREKLNNRFQELSVKSSLSEFVVNSRQLLDINAVRMAAETILKNEKPCPAQGDHTIPVDHTFFLANFCTTSLASSMMASFVPKPVPIVVDQDARGPQGGGYQAAAQPQSSGGGQPSQPQQQAPPPRRINGQQQPSQAAQQGGQADLTGAGAPEIDATNGIAINQGGAVVPPPGMTMRDVEGGLDKYLAAVNGGNVDLNGGGLYPGSGRCELVSAISQIAQKPDPKKKSSKGVDPWGKMTEPASAQDTSTDSSDAATTTVSPAAAAAPAVGSAGGGELNLPNDASSDSISTESEDRAGNTDVSVASGSSDKPLSFARIASLNIGESSIARPPKAIPGPGAGAAPNNLLAMAMANPQMPPQQLSMPPSLSSTMVTNLMAGPPPPPPQGPAPQPMMGMQAIPMPITLPPSSNPRFFFDIQSEGKRLGRVIIEVQASVAPKMALNFSMLVTGERGFGYKGCQFFQAWRNESVICGDWEHNSGRGGRAALGEGALFTPDDTRLPCVRGAVGMRRMSKKHSSLNQVASQFRIILANMNTQFTGIFGHIVSGIEALDKVADMGGEGGRPEKTALVSNCGIYKP